MRNILTVTRMMLAVIPKSQTKLIKELWCIRDDNLYNPPENQTEGWYDLSKCINNQFGTRYDSLREWEKIVVDILEDRINEHNVR